MKRRSFLAAAPALGLIGLPAPLLARPAPSFEKRAEEIAEMMRQHFRPTLPEGVEYYDIIIKDAPGIPMGPNEVRMIGSAGVLNWFPAGGGWH